MFNRHPTCFLDKSLAFLSVQRTSKLFDGKFISFRNVKRKFIFFMVKSLNCLNVSMHNQIAWWKNHWHSYMPNENPNCLMGKTLDSLNVQWTSKLFHGQISWFPKCSMNIRIVSWTNPLIPWMFNEHTNCYVQIS